MRAKAKPVKGAARSKAAKRAKPPPRGKPVGRAPAATNGSPSAPRARAAAEPEPELVRVLRDDGTIAKGDDPKLPAALLLHLYEQMVQVREFDRRMLMLQRQGRIGFYGPILGQEAATVGSTAAMADHDWIFPALREGAAAMMRGLSLESAIDQLIGNAGDRCKGRQMPCHYTFVEGHYYGMSSVIGTQISHAVGAAMAARIRGDDTVVLGYLGDGAVSANDFHCGMNFAAVYRAPCVLFCQNNQWAISVPVHKQHATKTIAEKGVAYGIPSVRVDGNDVLAVYAVTREAVARARRGDGPTFVEAVTYRRLGHSSSDDPTKYRDDAEVKAWEAKDPIDRCRRHLAVRGLWDEAKEKSLQQRIADAVAAATARAEAKDPQPAPETLITDVFAQPTAAMREQLAEVLALEGKRVNEGAFPL